MRELIFALRMESPATLKAPDGQQLTRSVKPGTTVKATDVVVVTFRVKVAGASNEGCWMLTDMAPSGLAPIQPNSEAWDDEESESPAIYWPIDVTGQRVSFCVERDPKHPVQTLRYLARVVTAGTYRWEPAILQSALAPERGSSTPATTLTIRRLTR